ncbi:hypothetical protein CB0940_10750 [Cercospora beticola]|uniref:Pleckstrin homology domain-containing protein n=1 Tax=Cercospora beticola TaxID=122368 RepID=A0A2G5HTG1_CERBT|nr:hypothetical protein CB0940_10750 [Cercospora beticola]PIA95819.1 hypothetical protein CB0940_10750 [Cercospora beticola]WPB07478.1 hypothetical protein RHO25_012139 [Cercospora beticola]
MADYFSEYSQYMGAKGLPSPADTPYETTGFLRSKRSSRATAASSREASPSPPPPLPSDARETQEQARDGRYSNMDPRRFTPTLHASLVSEILKLRRELDSKNNLVENLEVNLSLAKNENDALNGQLSESAREVRKAKQQVQQIEQGTYEAVEDLVRERDEARATLEELRAKFELAQKKTRQQDEDAERTQNIWENDKEAWDSERRQLERRIHVTETRLRAVVDEMNAQQSQTQSDAATDDSTFKDSGFGNESDTGSIYSATPSASPKKHRRNMSSISFVHRHMRSSVVSRTTAATPDLYFRPGNTLADELDIDELDEYDNEDSVNGDDTPESAAQMKHEAAARSNSANVELDAKAKRVVGLTTDSLESPSAKNFPKLEVESEGQRQPTKQYQDRATTPPPAAFHTPVPDVRATYVDAGYQPSPPVSPPRVEVTRPGDDIANENLEDEMRQQPPPAIDVNASLQQPQPTLSHKPISPPETPVVDVGGTWVHHKPELTVVLEYSTASTQTDPVEQEPPRSGHNPKRDSLSPPSFVPSIAIHPPSSRPSSPRPYALPPGTKNATAQANMGWPSRDACMQTEEIRIDQRPVKLPPHLLPSSLLPSPSFQENSRPQSKRISASSVLTKRASFNRPPAISIPASPPLQSPTDSSPDMARNNGARDLRHYPLKALPLPRPVLSPPLPVNETFQSNGPLNRSSQYGVTQPKTDYMGGQEPESSEQSDYEDPVEDHDPADLIASMPVTSRPPLGRFGLSDPPKAVPEDKEISPERRPGTSDSHAAAPAPSISSSRATSSRRHTQQPQARLGRSPRSPSFTSMASSSQSAYQSDPLPPYPIPLRSSSRPKPQSEGSQSPTPHDGFGTRTGRTGRSHARQASLRKVQSAAIIRNRHGRTSPTKGHRRSRRSPQLTPVQSMAFDSPAPTKFPIPELPSPVREYPHVKGSVDLRSSPGESSQGGEETNLVDAIAATMVGEWMWKYIRKRKSFGMGDDTSEMPVASENGIVNVTAHGTRHKRWVWLSPYERTIMWDTKQPSSGTALLGKRGRKLTITSVLDVQDRTPLPKNAELPSAWGRSILILTPQRALKFTATTEERHGLWMAALTFLARESTLPNQIPPMPTPALPIPPTPHAEADGVDIKRHRSPSIGRSNVRDSIRITKGKKAELHKVQSHPDETYSSDLAGVGLEPGSADFPAVPRLYISTTRHQRNRSNTNPGFRSISSGGVPSSASSGNYYRSTNGSSFRPSMSTKSGSRRESFASPVHQNFFEAVGTVRMEAFVDPNVRDGVLYVPAPPPVIGGARRPRRSSNLSQSTVDKRRAGYVFDEDGMDPFKGF